MNDERYIRQTMLTEIGPHGQKKIVKTKVLVIGVGGLGNALLPVLTSAGIGHLGLVDGDVVSQSNLHRQTLYTRADIGNLKVEVAQTRLKALNASTQISTYPFYLTASNATQLFSEYDIIVDATDRISPRYLINDHCVLTQKPMVHAAIFKFQLQVSVFNYKNGPTYRCLYPKAPENTKSCDETGVMPTTVALAGLFQANEVIKISIEHPEVLSGKLLMLDTLSMKQQLFRFSKKEPSTGDLYSKKRQSSGDTVSFETARQQQMILLDVRQPAETPTLHLPAIQNIPIDLLSEHVNTLPKTAAIAVFCQSGVRSKQAGEILKKQGFKQVYILEENAPEIHNLLYDEKEKKERLY